MGTVRGRWPELLEHELTMRQAGDPGAAQVLDKYPTDLAGRASAFKAMVTGGMDDPPSRSPRRGC